MEREMNEEIIKMALEACEVPLVEQLERVPKDARLVIDDADGMGTRFIPVGRMCHEAATALRTQIALEKQQPADEPVAWMHVQGDYEEPSLFQLDGPSMDRGWDEYPLYTRPQPAAQWVGLTMEDKQEYVAQDYGGNRLDAMDWAEKRLKEKNT